jgi:hypothetical protein
MSIRATNFVRRLRGLSPSEKAVAFVLADHENHKTGEITASMTTVAAESGIRNRETTSRLTKGLVARKILTTDNPSKGGKPTVYRIDYNWSNCDSPVTVETPGTVTGTMTGDGVNRDSGAVENARTVTLEGVNRDSPVTGRGRREKKERENPEGEEGAARRNGFRPTAITAAAPPSSPALEVLGPVLIDEAFAWIDPKPFGPFKEQVLFASFYQMRGEKYPSDVIEAFCVEKQRRGWYVGDKWVALKRAAVQREAKQAQPIESIQERHSRNNAEAILEVLRPSADAEHVERIRAAIGVSQERGLIADYALVGLARCPACEPDGWKKCPDGKVVRCTHEEMRKAAS